MRKKMLLMPFFFIGMAALVTWVLMILWNWLMPVLFGLSIISFWQAFGLLLMSKILFGGLHGGKHKCCGHHGHSNSWKSKFKHKWHKMSDEDKRRWEEKFAGTVYSCSVNVEKEAEKSKLNEEKEGEE